MKLVTTYEVEGCWSTQNLLKSSPTRCRKCGSIMEPVPQEGHFNSKYWELQRLEDEVLVCCPEGCKEKDAVNAWRTYDKVRSWCTEGSKSYD